MYRTVEVRFKIVRNGADFGEIYALPSSTPMLRMDDQGEIKTSLSGTFALSPDVNWFSDMIRPELWIDGTPHPLGLFLPATVSDNEDETTKSVNVEAYDRCWLLRDTYTENLLYFPAGTKYTTAVQQLLTGAGVTAANVTQSAATLTEDREDWPIGTSYLEIANQLLSEINYNPVWFDASGMAIIEPASLPLGGALDHTLTDEDVRSLLLPQISKQTDAYMAANVIICICSNADKDADLVATAENTNPDSPLSIVRRGRRICRIEQVDNIASQEELQAYANRLRNETMLLGETITVSTGLLPGFGVADVTALHYGDLAALCVERGWSMELVTGGTMTHRLERVVIALG